MSLFRRQPPAAALAAARHAFTLVELLVSIALVLILILGVNQVFKITSDTVGSAQTFSEKTRDHRAAQAALQGDFRAALPYDGPCILLDASVTPGYRNAADAQADRDGNMLTVDINGNNSEGESGVAGEQIGRLTVNYRNHRTDIFSFFARGLFSRQTGNPDIYLATNPFDPGASSNEAWINYGHLRLHNDVGTFFETASYPSPGVASTPADPNPNNYYASDWVLGRSQILLQQPLSSGVFAIRPGTTSTVRPLNVNARSGAVAREASRNYRIQDSRFDIAETGIEAFRQQLIAGIPADPNWYASLSYPFWGAKHVRKPAEPAEVAQCNPIFLAGCTQFIAEFAGDFIQQNADGTIIDQPNARNGTEAWKGDGVVDFIYEGAAPNGVRRIRWYGFPRDVASPRSNTTFLGGPDGAINPNVDVVPVRDLRGAVSPFEKILPTSAVLAPGDNYIGQTLTPTAAAPRYFAAFAPSDLAKATPGRPTMFRITVVLDEPGGRLSDGQTYEYVLKLGL